MCRLHIRRHPKSEWIANMGKMHDYIEDSDGGDGDGVAVDNLM